MPFTTSAVTSLGTALGSSSFTLGSAVSAVGTVLGGVAAAKAANYQAKVAQINAQIAEENARSAALETQQQQVDLDMETLGLLGEQLAEQGASGFAVDSRSAVRLRESAKALGRKDAKKLRAAGAKRVRSFQMEAAGQRASAALAKSQGSNSLLQSFLGGVGSFVGSARPTIYSGRVY